MTGGDVWGDTEAFKFFVFLFGRV